MSFKTILTHVDQSRNMDARTELTSQIARAQGAHVTGVASLGISHYFFENKRAGGQDPAVSAHLAGLQARAEAAAKVFQEILQRKGVTSCETHVVHDDAFGSIEHRLRYCDLTILGQYDPDCSPNPMDASLVEDVLLGGGGPALVVPRSTQSVAVDGRVLLAWNGSVQARRAVRDALPLLQGASSVEIAVFTPDAHGDELGVGLLRYLQRHGIRAGLINQKASDRDAGDSLLSLIDELRADMLVMGCYGHSRFQETILGGVTRTILQSMPVPVFMSH